MLATTTHKNNGSPVLTTSRTWDYGMRLQAIVNTVNNVPVTSHRYLYDSVHRRSQATLEDGSIWKYDYNDRNEVTSGKRYWPDWTRVAGQQFEYAFDNIGNRTSTKAGGDANGANLRSASYTANQLNQITNRTVPSAVDVLGAAKATASVTINGVAATTRKTEYFHKEVSVANAAGPTNASVTVTATEGANNTTESGSLLVPPATQDFFYDRDGNLTNDSVWGYSWNTENRLTQMTNLTTVTSSARKKLVFTYDFMGRRTTKKVYPWSGSSYSTTPETDVKFLYDGWNLIAELNATNNAVIRSYMWGQDLSRTINEAGGIGGLVLVAEHGASPTYHFAGYDANGNVIGLVNAANSSVSARYEYSAFGEMLRVSGTFAKSNPFRWSTKYTDDECGLIVYQERIYAPALGRWISRDPSEEDGGLNLYSFVDNSPTRWIDALGYSKTDPWPTDVDKRYKEVIERFKQDNKIKGDLTPDDIRLMYQADLAEHGSIDKIVKKRGNKRNKPQRGGKRNFVSSRLGAAGNAVSVAMMAYTYVDAKMLLRDIKDLAEQGYVAEPGSAESHLFDLVRHFNDGDSAEVDLDSLTYIIEAGQTGANALLMFFAFEDEINSW